MLDQEEVQPETRGSTTNVKRKEKTVARKNPQTQSMIGVAVIAGGVVLRCGQVE
jgi:hypothetical protein